MSPLLHSDTTKTFWWFQETAKLFLTVHSPKLSPPMATQWRQLINQNNDSTKITVIRISFIVWAFLRLPVSVLWTGVLILGTSEQLTYSPHSHTPPSRLVFGTIAIEVQLLEIAMLVTFIVAGLKKSASLYRAYYWYCILSLIIYVVSATLFVLLDYDHGHYFGELYLLYHFFHIRLITGNYVLAFFITSIVDFVLEIFLICLIKKLMNNYRHHDNKHVAEETA